MIDVRLTATNPEDSTLVPVPCNVRGELLTVAPVIESIPNDVEIQGDLTVTGLINGSIGVGEPGPPGPEGPEGPEGPKGEDGLSGIGLPEPIGTEGQILKVVNGEPAWADGPLNPFEVNIGISDEANAVVYDQNGGIYNGSDSAAYAKSQAGWMNLAVQERSGFQVLPSSSQGTGTPFQMTFTSPGESYVTLLFAAYAQYNDFPSDYNFGYACESSNSEVTIESVEGEPTYINMSGGGPRWATISVVVKLMGGLVSTGLTLNVSRFFHEAMATRCQATFRGWSVMTPGQYAVKRQNDLQRELTELRAAIAANS